MHLIMLFSPRNCSLIPIKHKASPQHPILKRLQPPFLPYVRDQVLHPYKTTGKIIVLCILIFTILVSKLEDQRFCTESTCTVSIVKFSGQLWYLTNSLTANKDVVFHCRTVDMI